MADVPHPAPDAPAPVPPAQPPVVVKKYANRRLYNTETSSYITLDNLADMIRAGRDFVVYDAKSGEDITRGVLTQIIVEEESKGTSMLPTPFLRQLIGFYGGSLQGVVPRYLETAMSSFARQQQQLRVAMQQTLSPFLPMGVEEMGRQNMAMIERAMSLFNPFHRGGEPLPAETSAPAPGVDTSEIGRLRHEVESLRAELATARADARSPVPEVQEPVRDLPHEDAPPSAQAEMPAAVQIEPAVRMEEQAPAQAKASVDPGELVHAASQVAVNVLADPAPTVPLHLNLPIPETAIPPAATGASANSVPDAPSRMPRRSRTPSGNSASPGKGAD